jgi:ABC-type glutathione transport system ATPase component
LKKGLSVLPVTKKLYIRLPVPLNNHHWGLYDSFRLSEERLGILTTKTKTSYEQGLCMVESIFKRTEIGANGINMSGGQRWRVAFAQALYSLAGTFILDDIFSAVDSVEVGQSHGP